MKKAIALTLSIIMIAAMFLTFTACEGSSDIKGTWEVGEEGESIAFIFGENDKFTMKNTITMSDGPYTTEATGTYKVDGNKVTITIVEKAEEEGGADTELEFGTFTFEIKGKTLKMAPVDDPDDSQEFTKK